MRPRVVCFTSFPPPVTGQNVMSAQVADWADGVADVVRVDTSDPGALSGRWQHAARLAGRWRALARALRTPTDAVYLVLSSTRAGRLRDAATVAIARRRARRVVGHVQVGDFGASLDRPGTRHLSRWLLRQLDAVVVLSERLAPPIQRHARPGAVRVIPNTAPGIVADDDELAQKRAQRAASPTLRVLFVANMLEGKGQGRVLAAAARYQASGPARPIRVDFVGRWPSPTARTAFQAEAERLGVADGVTVHGAIADRGRVRALFLDADIVALPSRYRHEALPVCLVEGLATGTPVVGTDHAAISDIVTPETGVLLADGEPDAVADAFRLLADPDVWAARSRGARDRFDRRFAPSVVRDAVLDALGLA